MNRYILHIGLHKTATKFLQHKVFPNLLESKFVYNPPRMTQLICDLIKAFKEDVEMVQAEIIKEKEFLKSKYNGKTIVISREVMSGDLFTFYKDKETTVYKLSTAFSGATVIYSLRYQVDWIISCYRESIHEHHYQSIDKFLRFKKSDSFFINNSYKDLDIHKYGKLLKESFGQENVHLLYYENFKKEKEQTVIKVANILGEKDIPIKIDNDRIPNRGYSAFAIKLSIFRAYFLIKIGLSKNIHRPIRFLGPNSIPAGFENLSILDKNKYWGGEFLRDNEEVRSINYPNLSKKEAKKLEWSWRNIIKNKLDKFFYWDWDLLGERRIEMDIYFKKLNKLNLPKDAPKVYF